MPTEAQYFQQFGSEYDDQVKLRDELVGSYIRFTSSYEEHPSHLVGMVLGNLEKKIEKITDEMRIFD